MPSSPGTVSKILWHFTGGPIWDAVEKRQKTELKPAEQAYNALCGIIRSRELRIGNYREIIHFEVPWYQIVGPGSIIVDMSRKMPDIIESCPAVCVAEIPVMHLNYHAERYGKLAIGFHRDSIIQAGFSPVFYQLVGAMMLEKIHGIYSMGKALAEDSTSSTKSQGDFGYHRDAKGNWVPSEDPTIKCVESLQENIQEFLAIVKSFKKEDIDTIYCEREWRAINPFKFSYNDVSMIVAPREGGYFERFAAEAELLSIPRTVPIVAWEDLVEH
jgi:hypothetical protein